MLQGNPAAVVREAGVNDFWIQMREPGDSAGTAGVHPPTAAISVIEGDPPVVEQLLPVLRQSKGAHERAGMGDGTLPALGHGLALERHGASNGVIIFRRTSCSTSVPVFHRLPERIKAHASICFMALILYRVMRQRLKLAGSELSPEAALTELRRIQRHTVSIDNGPPISGVSTIDPSQAQTLTALNINKPTIDPQMSLL